MLNIGNSTIFTKGLIMDSEIIYSIIGIVFLIIVLVMTFRNNSEVDVKTKAQKREEILIDYKNELQSVLTSFENDKQARMAKKSSLLKKYSDELSRNIFFDQSEIKEIILELSSV